MSGLSEHLANILWSQDLGRYVVIGADNKAHVIDTRTQEQKDFDAAMVELEKWLASPHEPKLTGR